MKSYCINLDSRVDRWRECLAEFQRIKLPSIIRIAARVETNPLDDCAMNHASCLGMSMTNQDEMCLVMEDDVQFVVDDWELIEKSVAELQAHDPDWDLLYLCLNADPDELKRSGPPTKLTPSLYRVFSGFAGHAYIVRSTVYQPIMQMLLRNLGTGIPYDVIYSRELLPSIRAYCVNPLMAVQRPNFSSIENCYTNNDYFFTRWETAIACSCRKLESGSNVEAPQARKEYSAHLKYSFGMIVLNGDDFIEYALRSVYNFAFEIIIVEGAVEEAAFMVGPDGGSRDDTINRIESFPDPDSKITLIRGRWKDKTEQSNIYMRTASGDYVWQLDSDEVYKEKDLVSIDEILSANKDSIDLVSFSPINFYHDFWTVGKGGRWEERTDPFRRIFKCEEGCYFSNHWPPTVVYPNMAKTRGLLSADVLECDFGIYIYHYSYVTQKQVEEKVEYYNRKGYSPIVGSDLGQWYETVWSKWTHPGCDVEKRLGSHLNRLKPTWTERFRGDHPEVMLSHPLFSEYWRSALKSPLKHFGTHYGGYVYPESLPGLGRNSVIYCFGAGEDISHDVAVGKVTGATVHIFDPTPRAIDHVVLAKAILDGQPWSIHQSSHYGGGDPQYWELILTEHIPGNQIQLHTWAVGTSNGQADFYLPNNPDWVSASLNPEGRCGKSIIVDVYTLRETMRRLGHTSIDLLKLDIECIECDVLSAMLSDEIRPKYLAVDFDSARIGETGLARAQEVLYELRCSGYNIIDQTDWNVSLLLIN